MQKLWSRLTLSQKLTLPFLGVFLSIFLLSLFAIGHWSVNSLEQNIRTEVEAFAERIHQDFQDEQQNLETQIQLIAGQESVRLAVEQLDKSMLLQMLLPLRTTLKLDLIKVVDIKGDILLDIRSSKLVHAKLIDRTIVASSGANFSDLVDVENSQQTLLANLQPIKSSARLLGGLIIGKLVDDNFLERIAAGSSKEIITMREKRIVATTLAAAHHTIWSPPSPKLPTVNVEIVRQRYLAKSIVFAGASHSLVATVLYPYKQLESAKWALWIEFGKVFFLGSAIVAILGVFIARTIVRPLKAVIQVATQVTRDANFNLQAPILTQDEVGVVAISLNKLIQLVKHLLAQQREATEQLEAYSQNLEQKVKDRTQELQQKNIALYQNIHQLKQTQAQLIQSEKMSALGQLVAGIAHEINNPVSFIYGNLTHANEYITYLIELIGLYEELYPKPRPEIKDKMAEIDLEFVVTDLKKLLYSMKMGSDRIRQIVNSLRNFSRLDESEVKAVDIHSGIDSTLLILQHRLHANNERQEIQVIKEYGQLPLVNCYASALNQVFMNIISNAIDALREAQENRSEWNKQPTLIIRTSVNNERNLLIRISDNGLGMNESVLNKIFEPFFTTKPVGSGTGLGLSISYSIIVEKHGGKLSCISALGEGTEFTIEIPA